MRRPARHFLRRVTAIVAMFGLLRGPSAVWAAPVGYSSGTYTQNFSGFQTTGSTASMTLNQMFEVNSLSGGGTVTGWYAYLSGGGSSTGNRWQGVDGGSSTAGGFRVMYSSTGGQLALGSQGSGSAQGFYGVVLQNDSGATIQNVSISYDAVINRNPSTTANSTAVSYRVSPTTVTTGSVSTGAGSFNDGAGAWTSTTLGFTTLSTGTGAPGTQAAVNPMFTIGTRAQTLSNINWGSNEFLYIRWSETDEGGSDATFGVDNFSFSAVSGVKDISWNTTSGTWDTSSANWTGGGSTFATGDNVTFSDSAGGTITVDGGGVSPGGTTISASAGTYTFTGGSIGGTGALTKSGAGAAVLSATNTHSGGTTVNGGVLEAASNAALGNASGGIALGGGTLRAGGSIDSTRPVTVGAGGGTIDTNGNAMTIASIAGTGGFTKAGPGTLTVTGALAGAAGGPLSVSGGSIRLGGTGNFDFNLPTGGSGFAGDLVLQNAGRIRVTNSGTLGGGGTIRAESDGGTITITGTGLAVDFANNIALDAGVTLAIGSTSGNTVTYSGAISGGSGIRFTNSHSSGGGAGTTILSGSNTYGGDTRFHNTDGAIVQLAGGSDRLPTGTTLVFGATATHGNSSLDLNGFNQTVAGLTNDVRETVGTVTNTNVSSLSTLTIGGNLTPAKPFGGTIAGNLALTKAGGGTVTLSGTNTYTGGTTVSDGTLSVAADAALGGSAGGITLGGGRLELTSGFTLGAGRTITAATGTSSTIAVTSGTVSYAGPFTGSGNLDKAGAGTLSVGNASSGYSGTFTISAGTLEVTAANAFANATLSQTGGTLLLAPVGGGDVVIPELGGSGGEVSVDSGASAVFRGNSNRAYDGRIRGQGAFKKEGNGILTLNADNDFTGNTRITQGRLKLGAGGGLSATPQIDIDSGAIFDVADKSGFALGTGQRLGGRGTVLGDLQFGGGSQLAFDPTGPLLIGSGTVSFASGFGIGSIFGLDANVAEGTYTLLNETTGGSISFASLANVGPGNPFDLGGGKSAYFQQGSLQVVVVPEPDAFFIGGLGLALAGLVANRRRSRGTAA